MAINNIKYNNICRISNSKKIVKILDLGLQPLANSLLDKREEYKQEYPLTISYSKKTKLIQLNETINKEILFNSYVWVTGTSKEVKEYSKKFFKFIINKLKIKKSDLIIELASNDGTFLKEFKKHNFKNILGIDPAKNIVKIANNKNKIRTICEYFNHKTSNKIKKKYGSAKLVIARNVIPHVSDLNSVIKGIKNLLNNESFGVIEFHDAAIIQNELHYDSIYHEHLCYFTINSFCKLLEHHKLYIVEYTKSKISGGSWVMVFKKNIKNHSKKIINLIKNENNKKINSIKNWKLFAKKVYTHRQKTLNMINKFSNKKIIGFGSSARSQTYLNFCQLDNKNIKFIIDNNKLKQGKFTPGSKIEIVSLKRGLAYKPDIIIILAWNFKNEIIKLCKENGFKGSFIIPFPNYPIIIKS